MRRPWSGVGLAIFNFANSFLPYRGFFAWRRVWLRACGILIGSRTKIASQSKFYGGCISIGEDAWVGPEVSLVSCDLGPIYIGHRVGVAPRVLLVTGSHVIGGQERRAGTGTGSGIVIGDGSWLGAGAIILGGARLGKGCVVAAGSRVLEREYPDNVLLAGSPATVKRSLKSE